MVETKVVIVVVYTMVVVVVETEVAAVVMETSTGGDCGCGDTDNGVGGTDRASYRGQSGKNMILKVFCVSTGCLFLLLPCFLAVLASNLSPTPHFILP